MKTEISDDENTLIFNGKTYEAKKSISCIPCAFWSTSMNQHYHCELISCGVIRYCDQEGGRKSEEPVYWVKKGVKK
jgi:hypothetical protein